MKQKQSVHITQRVLVTLELRRHPYLSLPKITTSSSFIMAKTGTKRSDKSRPQGRQNAFSGIKLAFLESYKDRFLKSTDRGAFYTMVAKGFLEKFRYSLPAEEDPTVDDKNVDAAGDNDPALQTSEEQSWDNEHHNKIYRELREVSIVFDYNKQATHNLARNLGAGTATDIHRKIQTSHI